jgi:hypothetical protein
MWNGKLIAINTMLKIGDCNMIKFTGKIPKTLMNAALKYEAKHPGVIAEIDHDDDGYWLYLNGHTVDNDGQHGYKSDDIQGVMSDIRMIRKCECQECPNWNEG